MDESSDPFLAHHVALVQIHEGLCSVVRSVVRSEGVSLDELVPQALHACRFLLGHHMAEDEGLFPGLRRLGRLRTTDVAFLDARDREHRELHAICERLESVARAAHPAETEIRSIAQALLEGLTLHLREEEAGLAPERLREMIDRAGFEAIGREIDELRRRFLARDQD